MSRELIRVGFQGERGAYSEDAAMRYFGATIEPVPFGSLEKVFLAVEAGEVSYGLVPVENSYAGTITQTEDLLERFDLYIVGEYLLAVRHALLGNTGCRLEELRRVYSHPQALEQCEAFLRERGLQGMPSLDTAGAAREVKERGRLDEAAIAHASCGAVYGLRVVKRSIQTSRTNRTRFLVLSREPVKASGEVKTSLVFETRHIPAALYKALGGFATNGINLVRIESRPSKKKPMHYAFHVDFVGSPSEKSVRNALGELRFFSRRVRILGTYPRASDR